MQIPYHLRIRLYKWCNHVTLPWVLGFPPPSLIIQTDASLQGLGFQIESQRFHGIFNKSVNQHTGAPDHIVRILYCPDKRTSDPDLMRQHNSYRSSSTKQFTTLSTLIPSRTDLEKSGMVQLDPNSFTHSREVQYPCRSTIKRNTIPSSEWSLPPRSFRLIRRLDPLLDLKVDLLATHLNNKLPVFVAPYPDQRQ